MISEKAKKLGALGAERITNRSNCSRGSQSDTPIYYKTLLYLPSLNLKETNWEWDLSIASRHPVIHQKASLVLKNTQLQRWASKASKEIGHRRQRPSERCRVSIQLKCTSPFHSHQQRHCLHPVMKPQSRRSCIQHRDSSVWLGGCWVSWKNPEELKKHNDSSQESLGISQALEMRVSLEF